MKVCCLCNGNVPISFKILNHILLPLFWTPGLPEGVLSNRPCTCVCQCVCVCPSSNISETAHWFFLIFCMKLGHHKGTKVTEPDFWRKILGGHKWGKTPFLGHFWCFFVHISPSSYVNLSSWVELSHGLFSKYRQTPLDNFKLTIYMKFQKMLMTGCRDMDKKHQKCP